MKQYLSVDDTSYVSEGVVLTDALIIRASSLIDGYCKREIGVKTYKERIPIYNQRGHVSYFPVIEVVSIQGRAAQGIMGNYFGIPSFETIDSSNVDIDKSIGTVLCGQSPFGSSFVDLEIEYTSGWETIPEKVKVACGILVSQLATNQNSNVKTKKDFDFSIEYFGNNMITPEVVDLLTEYKIRFFR